MRSNGYAILLPDQHADPDREPRGERAGPCKPTRSAAIDGMDSPSERHHRATNEQPTAPKAKPEEESE